MKKMIGCFLFFVMLFSLFSAVSVAVEENTVSGFFNIGIKENISVSACLNDDLAESMSIDVDDDNTKDLLYVDSNNLKVSYAVQDNEGYYGVLLVEGNALPTIDNAILYIHQVSPKANVVEFDVRPILPKSADGSKKITDLTLYISCSKSEDSLVSIPVSYVSGFDVSDTVFIPGDVNSDGKVSSFDRTYLARYVARWDGYNEKTVNLSAADVFADGTVNALDRTVLSRHVARWEGYEVIPITEVP